MKPELDRSQELIDIFDKSAVRHLLSRGDTVPNPGFSKLKLKNRLFHLSSFEFWHTRDPYFRIHYTPKVSHSLVEAMKRWPGYFDANETGSNFRCDPQEVLSALAAFLRADGATDNAEEQISEEDKKLATTSSPQGPLNRILCGPPGTGKTYRSIAEAMSIITGEPVAELMAPDMYADTKIDFDALRADGQIEFVTFHPSFSYEDFVQGIRPVADTGEIAYEVADGTLKLIAAKAARNWQQSLVKENEGLSGEEEFDRVYAQVLTDIAVADEGKVQTSLSNESVADVTLSVRGGGLTIQTRGSGTAYPISRSRLKSVWLQRGSVKKVTDIKLPLPTYFWALLQLLVRTQERMGPASPAHPGPLRNFVLIIDEINRGNISKIFGELITLIEDDKRLGATNEITVRLPQANKDEPAFGLPPNLYVVGTMNTADRSVTAIDTALRRRFSFTELMPDLSALSATQVDGIDLRRLLSKINERIEFLFDREHCVGHAYLCNVASFADVSAAITHKIIPLLQEYFHDDWSKIQLVLDGPRLPGALQIVTAVSQEPSNLFGSKTDGLMPSVRYAVRVPVSVAMVQAIYE